MKYIFSVLVFSLLFTGVVRSQDIVLQQHEAENLEKQFKEEQAYEKYRSLTSVAANNAGLQVKCALLAMNIGGRQTDKSQKKMYFEMAKNHAERALVIDSKLADANYAMAVVAGGMTEVADEAKKKVEYVKFIKDYADKALAINPNHARANHVMGKWHYEVNDLGWLKKAAIKAVFGGMPEASLDSAIAYMEKCRSFDMYYALNYLDLAKAYKANNKPAKTIEILNILVKLPNRMQDDIKIKEAGKKMLQEMM
jgi:hypothetical protein